MATKKENKEKMDELLKEEKPKTKKDFGKYYLHNGKECYWRGPIVIFGEVISGKVTKKQMSEFKKKAPANIDLDRWVRDYDPVEKRKREAKAKMKRRLGLSDD